MVVTLLSNNRKGDFCMSNSTPSTEFDPLSYGFEEVSPYSIGDMNPFKRIGKDWMLITAKDKNGKVNAMTASWGTLGELWNRPVAICYVRPQRYTFELTEHSECFSLCFLGEKYRNALAFCGRESGRSTDKLASTGLDAALVGDAPVILQSGLILVCKKLYSDYLKYENFTDKSVAHKNYPNNDFHRTYICEIVKAYIKKQ